MTPPTCAICGRPWSEMRPIGSSGGLDYRHCPCGDTWSWPTPEITNEPCTCRGANAVEIVPGHQSARFAGERQEKRGLK